MRHSQLAAVVILCLASACTRGFDEASGPPPNPRFKGPSEAIEGPPGGTRFEIPAPGTYRYSSSYLETGNDHTHSETLRISSADRGESKITRSWWRQDRELPWFETFIHTNDATRLSSFSLTEANEPPCILEPPLVWIPRTIAPGATWKGRSVCRNDSGFQRYVDIEMRVSTETQVVVGSQTVGAFKLEGRLLIFREFNVFTMNVERQVSPQYGLVLTETWRFSDPQSGSGRIERTMTALSPI